MTGEESAMWYSEGITGVAFTAEHLQLKSTIRNTQNGISEKNLLNGWSLFASHVIKLNIIETSTFRWYYYTFFKLKKTYATPKTIFPRHQKEESRI
jgi:hypothetical protein